jgi:predicted nucleotide-binding protein
MEPERAKDELTRLRAQAEDVLEIQQEGPEHDRWKASIDAVMANSLPAHSQTLQKFRSMSYNVGVYTGAPGEDERDRRYFASQVRRAAALVDAAIFELDLLAPDSVPRQEERSGQRDSIFVVHGHDDAHKHELVRLLDRTTPLNAVVLHEQANRGATLIEKLERHTEDAAFAVVLLTADDEGRAKTGDAALQSRARQNVVFEMGVFFGLLARQRVAVLYDQGVEIPSDLAGLIYIPLDDSGAWRLALLKELEAAGIAVDRAKIP